MDYNTNARSYWDWFQKCMWTPGRFLIAARLEHIIVFEILKLMKQVNRLKLFSTVEVFPLVAVVDTTWKIPNVQMKMKQFKRTTNILKYWDASVSVYKKTSCIVNWQYGTKIFWKLEFFFCFDHSSWVSVKTEVRMPMAQKEHWRPTLPISSHIWSRFNKRHLLVFSWFLDLASHPAVISVVGFLTGSRAELLCE